VSRAGSNHLPDSDGRLLMACDCGRHIQPVPAEHVREGIGWTCSPTCTPKETRDA
jgi:hypothetical protein